MNIIKPPSLKKGNTIGILATAGAVESKENVLRAKQFFEERGYRVVLSENVFDKCRYLAGDDEKKVEELHKFFLNPEINAIICMRGGYGAIRLIEKINYDIIRKNPKIFCGYSDISALSAMIYKRAGLITYSGPLAQSDFGLENPSSFTIKAFFDAVTSDNPLVITPSNGVCYLDGDAEGILWGGNLATIVSLCGVDFLPAEKFIFFTEELNESVYRIDKMMTQLMNIKQFRDNVQAIVLGDFLDIDNKNWLDDLFYEIADKLQVPVLGGFKITHEKDKVTLPYGAISKLQNQKLYIR